MYEDPFRVHLSNVDLLTNAGIAPPPEWVALRKRHTDYLALESPVRQQLVAAVAEPTDGDLVTLHALSLAEIATPQATAQIHNAVTAAVRHRLVELYSTVAGANYKKLATRFDSVAQKFSAAVLVVDPESDASAVVTADAKSRTAWSEAALIANDLDALVPVLIAAATLAGVTVHARDGLLPLTVDPTGLHVRRTWEAWSTQSGRTWRWGALVKLGATLRACPLDDYQPLRQPKPMETRVEQIARGQTRTYQVDPEDLNYKPAPIPPTRTGTMMVT